MQEPRIEWQRCSVPFALVFSLSQLCWSKSEVLQLQILQQSFRWNTTKILKKGDFECYVTTNHFFWGGNRTSDFQRFPCWSFGDAGLCIMLPQENPTHRSEGVLCSHVLNKRVLMENVKRSPKTDINGGDVWTHISRDTTVPCKGTTTTTTTPVVLHLMALMTPQSPASKFSMPCLITFEHQNLSLDVGRGSADIGNCKRFRNIQNLWLRSIGSTAGDVSNLARLEWFRTHSLS